MLPRCTLPCCHIGCVKLIGNGDWAAVKLPQLGVPIREKGQGVEAGRGGEGYGLCRCLATNVSIVKIAPFHVCRKCQTVPPAQINCHMPPDEPPSLLLFVAVPSQCCALGIYRVNADPVNLFTFRQRATEMTLYGCMPQKAAARLDFCFLLLLLLCIYFLFLGGCDWGWAASETAEAVAATRSEQVATGSKPSKPATCNLQLAVGSIVFCLPLDWFWLLWFACFMRFMQH